MFQKAFPEDLRDNVEIVEGKIPNKIFHDAGEVSYVFRGNVISIPYRQYFEEIPENVILNLTQQQANILHCIYSRSSNGYIREKHVKALLENEAIPDFAAPFIVKVCDEYVVEILELVYSMLCDKDTTVFKEFCIENRQMFCKSYARMISYWNEFYRDRWYHYNQYIGKKLFRVCFGYSRSLELRSTRNVLRLKKSMETNNLSQQSQEFFLKMLELFPNTYNTVNKSIDKNGTILETVIIEDVFCPELINLLASNNNPKILSDVFTYFEKVSKSDDLRFVNIFKITVLEILGNDQGILETARKYMGPITYKLQIEADRGLGREVNE